MSILKGIFGTSSKSGLEKNFTADAIENLSNVEEMLKKRQEYLESEIKNETVRALDYSKQGNRRQALNALRKKKKNEKILAQIDGTLTTLEIQRESLEDAKSNAEIFRVMKQASDALKHANKNINMDDVDNLTDDIAEQHELMEQLTNALSQPIPGMSDLYNDVDLETELEALAATESHHDMMTIGRLPVPPITPSTKQDEESTKIRESLPAS